MFGGKCMLLHAFLQEICFKMPVKSSNSCQTIIRRKRHISPCYCTVQCTHNMLQNACEKSEFLSNNCSGEKNVHLHAYTGNIRSYTLICFKMPVRSWNSCLTIGQRKRRISSWICTLYRQYASKCM
jgi:hypothetical protein